MDDQNNQGPDENTNTFTLNLSDMPGQGGDPNLAETQAYTPSAGQPPAIAGDPFGQTQTVPAQHVPYAEGSMTGTDAAMGTGTGDTLNPDYDPNLALPSQMPMTGANDYHMSAEAAYSTADAVGDDPEERRKKIMTTAGLAVVFAFFCFIVYLVYEATEMGVDPVNHIMAAVGLAEPEMAQIDAIPQRNASPNLRPSRPRAANPAKTKTKQVQPATVGIAPENPYWDLPNPVPLKRDPDVREWSTEERVVWKGGITDKYNYQRFKTIKEVRSYQLKGSEEILWKGLKEKKLWLRMSAVMGLAEFGVPVDVDLVEQALGDARPSLIRNYFKRFKSRRTAGELFVMRQAIKIVNASSRLEILRAMVRTNDNLREVYLAAATFDPGYGVAGFANNQLARLKVEKQRYESLRNYVLGTEELPAEISASLADEQPKSIDAQKVEEVSTVEKIEFFGGVQSESISDEGMIEDGGTDVNVIEIKDEDLK